MVKNLSRLAISKKLKYFNADELIEGAGEGRPISFPN
jgi:hypothetical protein